MKVLILIKNILQAIKNGTLLLRLHLTKHFIKILICMFMCAVTIWFSLLIDNSLTKVKKNNDILKKQQNEITIKTFQLSEINRISSIDKKLENMGSKVRRPEKPATVLE